MNDSIEPVGSDLPDFIAAGVQTSALDDGTALQQDPAVGGSYVRNTNTGALIKHDPAPEQE